MSLAAETREAARRQPFLLAGLRAGVVNYTAAARFLDVDGDEDAVATALRRFADELGDRRTDDRAVRVTMHRGAGVVDADAGDEPHGDPLLSVGGAAVTPDAGDLTALLATGAVDAAALSAVLDRLLAADTDVAAAGVAGETLLVAVPGRAGATAVRSVEEALAAVPEREA